jgi:hypothetical protein
LEQAIRETVAGLPNQVRRCRARPLLAVMIAASRAAEAFGLESILAETFPLSALKPLARLEVHLLAGQREDGNYDELPHFDCDGGLPK